MSQKYFIYTVVYLYNHKYIHLYITRMILLLEYLQINTTFQPSPLFTSLKPISKLI